MAAPLGEPAAFGFQPGVQRSSSPGSGSVAREQTLRSLGFDDAGRKVLIR
jgi:hypothetical protein